MAAFINVRRRQPRNFRHSAHLNDLSEREVRSRYRFSSHGIDFIEQMLADDLQPSTQRNEALCPREQLLIALRYYASGSFLEVIGDTLGYNKATVSRVIAKVTDSIIGHMNEFITWPDRLEKDRIRQGFFQFAGFPNVIGAIDGTHVRIQGPKEDEASFVNRKGYHSVSVQAVCDHEGKFTSLNASWPGSCHDSHVFRTSGLCQRLERENRRLSDGILLGDSGYPNRPFLLTPYMLANTDAKQVYQQKHTATRVTVERAFGRLKRRFHVLHSEIRMSPLKACKIASACAILHNLAIMLKEAEDFEDDVSMDEDDDEDDDEEDEDKPRGRQDGNAVRDYFVDRYFS